MDQDRFARLRPEDSIDDQRCGEPFHHHRRRLLVGYAAWKLDQALRRNIARLRISTGPFEELAAHAGISDAIAGRNVGDPFADALDHAGGFVAKDDREAQRPRQVEAATAHIEVGIVDSNRGVTDARLTRSGGRERDLLPAHHLGTTVGVNADGLDHDDAWARSAA